MASLLIQPWVLPCPRLVARSRFPAIPAEPRTGGSRHSLPGASRPTAVLFKSSWLPPGAPRLLTSLAVSYRGPGLSTCIPTSTATHTTPIGSIASTVDLPSEATNALRSELWTGVLHDAEQFSVLYHLSLCQTSRIPVARRRSSREYLK